MNRNVCLSFLKICLFSHQLLMCVRLFPVCVCARVPESECVSVCVCLGGIEHNEYGKAVGRDN